MIKPIDSNVNKFLNEMKQYYPDKFGIISSIRNVFFSNKSILNEEIKYGGLLYLNDSGPVGGIFSYKDHISIEFSRGASFKDPQKKLQGSGKFRRHLKIEFGKQLDLDLVKFYLNQI